MWRSWRGCSRPTAHDAQTSSPSQSLKYPGLQAAHGALEALAPDAPRVQPPTHRHWLRAVAASAVCHSWSGHASQDSAAAAGW